MALVVSLYIKDIPGWALGYLQDLASWGGKGREQSLASQTLLEVQKS